MAAMAQTSGVDEDPHVLVSQLHELANSLRDGSRRVPLGASPLPARCIELVQTAGTDTPTELVHEALRVLANLVADCNENRARVVQLGGVAPAVSLLARISAAPGTTLSLEQLQVIAACIGYLTNVQMDYAPAQGALRAAKAAPVLATLVLSDRVYKPYAWAQPPNVEVDGTEPEIRTQLSTTAVQWGVRLVHELVTHETDTDGTPSATDSSSTHGDDAAAVQETLAPVPLLERVYAAFANAPAPSAAVPENADELAEAELELLELLSSVLMHVAERDPRVSRAFCTGPNAPLDTLMRALELRAPPAVLVRADGEPAFAAHDAVRRALSAAVLALSDSLRSAGVLAARDGTPQLALSHTSIARILHWAASDNMRLRASAYLVLGNVARDETHCAAVLAQGSLVHGAVVFLQSCTAHDTELAYAALSMLRNLAVSDAGKRQLAALGLHRAVEHVLHTFAGSVGPPATLRTLGVSTLRISVSAASRPENAVDVAGTWPGAASSLFPTLCALSRETHESTVRGEVARTFALMVRALFSAGAGAEGEARIATERALEPTAVHAALDAAREHVQQDAVLETLCDVLPVTTQAPAVAGELVLALALISVRPRSAALLHALVRDFGSTAGSGAPHSAAAALAAVMLQARAEVQSNACALVLGLLSSARGAGANAQADAVALSHTVRGTLATLAESQTSENAADALAAADSALETRAEA